MSESDKLQTVFDELEATWRRPRQGAEEATQESIKKVKSGETLIFVYPHAAPEVVDRIIEESGGVGQFDLPLYHTDPLLHVFIPKEEI